MEHESLSFKSRQTLVILLAFFFLAGLLIVAWKEGLRSHVVSKPDVIVTKENSDCVQCHKVKTPGIVAQWEESVHSKSGIGCLQCHEAKSGDADAFKHEGVLIATIVSPQDCARCHIDESKQFAESHHAKGAEIIGSLDNVLAEVVEGHVEFDAQGNKTKLSPAAVSGCWQCHGTEVKVLPGGKLDPATWPNTGIGRINPDGSRGSCSACHLRHDFSIAQARAPENCGRCHLGPDHPQLEIYNESKHGIAFEANRTRFEPLMEKREWIPGVQYEQGPTCASCHMGATRTLPVTHDVGSRISWTLRPAVSEKIDAAAKKKGKEVKPWEVRRDEMKNVCFSCHATSWVENWYTQFDNAVELYNNKFGIPSTRLYKMAREGNLLTSTEFDEELEFTYYFLWHHEGRRARHGASMMAPDYTQWHGFYEVAHRFYMEFVPQLKEAAERGLRSGDPKKQQAARELKKALDETLKSDMHRWFVGGMSKQESEMRKKAQEEFKKRYAQ